MRLFRRKTTDEVSEERCPYCSERLPEGANECQMCGANLTPLGTRSPEQLGKEPAVPR
jgi:predicted amidophosphoribosyltransferase